MGLTVNLLSQTPHGDQFRVNCADCHSSDSWEIPFDAWDRTGPVFSRTTGWQIGWDSARFSHTKTDFPLSGQHVQADCRDCHKTLVFSEAGSTCISCHTDMHNGTVGSDCARCHTTENWLVDNIPELHHDNGFPLVGAHAIAVCTDCHKSETGLQFNRIGNDCINCHLSDFAATSSPNHQEAGFSTNCADCHNMNRFDWKTDKVNHDFFPLTKGHDIADCTKCHTSAYYSNTPSDCVACHKNDYETALIPDHKASNFSQNCIECHTTDLDWMPAKYAQHDADYFPIYSGKHKGEWDQCLDCHKNPSNYAEFTCTTCHTNPETNNEHNGVNGYSYNSPACLACHPTGSEDDGFDHSKTNFPLTGAHLTAACIDCHASGYAGTPTDCASCHTDDYNQTTNPNHVTAQFPTDCASCHSETAWTPATFNHDDLYFPIYSGKHKDEWNQCTDCHTTPGNYAAFSCTVCHGKSETDDDHQDVNNYSYSSPACLSCHPKGD